MRFSNYGLFVLFSWSFKVCIKCNYKLLMGNYKINDKTATSNVNETHSSYSGLALTKY